MGSEAGGANLKIWETDARPVRTDIFIAEKNPTACPVGFLFGLCVNVIKMTRLQEPIWSYEIAEREVGDA